MVGSAVGGARAKDVVTTPTPRKPVQNSVVRDMPGRTRLRPRGWGVRELLRSCAQRVIKPDLAVVGCMRASFVA